jgi:hypothetical protein
MAEMDGVNVGHRKYLVQVVQRLDLFYHRYDQQFPVGCARPFRGVRDADTEISGAAAIVESTLALGMKPRSLDQFPQVVSRGTSRNVDTLGAGIKEVQNKVGVSGQPDDRSNVPGLGSPDHVDDLLFIHGLVFGIDRDKVKTHDSAEFDQAGDGKEIPAPTTL